MAGKGSGPRCKRFYLGCCDRLATGNAIMEGKKLLEKLGIHVEKGAAIVELPEMDGSNKL